MIVRNAVQSRVEQRRVQQTTRHGAAAGIQLGHSGRKARLTRPWEGGTPLTGSEPEIYDWDGWELVAPSAVPHSKSSPTPRALTHDEVKQLLTAWIDAARRADACGFDMLEIHAAHGYLLHQFLSPIANVRNDEYGGSEDNRMRFPVEVAAGIRNGHLRGRLVVRTCIIQGTEVRGGGPTIFQGHRQGVGPGVECCIGVVQLLVVRASRCQFRKRTFHVPSQ